MITRLRVSTIWSENVNNLLPFYRDILSLPAEMESEDFVLLGEPNTSQVALGTHSEVRGHASDPHRHIIGFETDDLQSDYQRLKGSGVQFIEAPNEQGGIWVATFIDPEGNLLQLLQFGKGQR